MKGLFKSKPKTPVELVQLTRELLIYVDKNTEVRERKREEKISELSKLILELRTVLFGNGQNEPSSDACAQLTQEFFKQDVFRLLIISLPKLDLGTRQNATHVIANLQRQRVNCRFIASEFMENNLDIMDILLPGYANGDIALTYGAISRECIRHQTVARYVLESEHMKKFFSYIQIPNFDISSDAQATFKELLTRHKSTVAQFLSKNYDWFFQEYNSQLLESTNYITRRHAVKDSKKTIQVDAFHVFKLFIANQSKPPEIVSVLFTNKSKLLRFLSDFTIDKGDEQFEADKAEVIREIASLEIRDQSCAESEDSEIEP
ncbi:hypothetical protein MANES_02G106400v8 [Manihot esculenta]|uniref:Uncharacterized protein n=1 Tax=Manihot esculenta TaxID=3983 RepID=A0ACB7I744_MANES|nr:hypothetical protein MANES_02G106400v8 [Manihot esculenta]